MAYLKTRRHPASAPWGYAWPDGDEVVPVADEHANQLLRISGGEFYEVLPGDPEHPDYQPEAETEPGDPEQQPEAEPGADEQPAQRTAIAEPDPDLHTDEHASDGARRTRQRHRSAE